MDLLAAVAHPRTEWNTGDLTAGTQWSAVFDLTAPSAFFCPNCDWTHMHALYLL